MPRLVAVTGATGFIGNALIQRLLNKGWDVRALTRKPQKNAESIQWIEGDLDDLDALNVLIKDAVSVIHCAASIRGNSFQEFAQTNVKGTRNLLEAITRLELPPRFLLISSMAAKYPHLSWYARSKNLAEEQLREFSDRIQWTIFRPPAVYGPGDKELKPLFQALYRGFLPVIGKTENRFGLIHVEDLTGAIEAWLDAEISTGEILELDDGLPMGYSYEDLAVLAQQIWKRPSRCIVIPDWLIRSIAVSNLWFSHFFNYSPMLTPGKVNELQHQNWVCDNAAIARVLPAWQANIRLQDVLSEVI